MAGKILVPGRVRMWNVPLTIVEYGRVAVIEAATKQEALEKFRRAEWECLTDTVERTKFRKAGPCTEDP